MGVASLTAQVGRPRSGAVKDFFQFCRFNQILISKEPSERFSGSPLVEKKLPQQQPHSANGNAVEQIPWLSGESQEIAAAGGEGGQKQDK